MFVLRLSACLSTGQIIGLPDLRLLSYCGRDGIISTNYADSDPPCGEGVGVCVCVCVCVCALTSQDTLVKVAVYP
jgi:hypothetical protein